MIKNWTLIDPSWHEPYALLGEQAALTPAGRPIYDIGKISRSVRINRWSKVKPVRSVAKFFASREDYIKAAAGVTVNFGFDFAKILSPSSFRDALARIEQNGNTWPYQGLESSDFASLDYWNGYNHAAKAVGGKSMPDEDIEAYPGEQLTVYFEDTGEIKLTDFQRIAVEATKLSYFVALLTGSGASADPQNQEIIYHSDNRISTRDSITFNVPEVQGMYKMFCGIADFTGEISANVIYLPYTLRLLTVTTSSYTVTYALQFEGPEWDTASRYTSLRCTFKVNNTRTSGFKAIPYLAARDSQGGIIRRYYAGDNNTAMTEVDIPARDLTEIPVAITYSEAVEGITTTKEYRAGIVIEGEDRSLSDWFNARNFAIFT